MKGQQSIFKTIYSITGYEDYLVLDSYQRNYVWGKAQINPFLKCIKESVSPYNVGTIIFYNNGNRENQIVDGQQRIITLYILVKVLNDLYKNSYDETINHCYKTLMKTENGNKRIVFKKKNAQDWFDNLMCKNQIESNAFGKAYKVIKSFFSGYSNEDLMDFFLKLKNNIQVLVAECETQTEAYRTFFGVNGLGKLVEPKYAILSNLFECVDKDYISTESEKQKIKETLEDIIESKDDSFVNRFLYHLEHKWFKKSDVVNEYSSLVKDETTIVKKFIDFSHGEEYMMDKIRCLHLMDYEPLYAYLDDVYYTYADYIDDEYKDELAKYINACCLKRSICSSISVHPNGYTGIIKQMIEQNITNIDDFDKQFTRAYSPKSDLYYGTNEEFISNLMSLNIYNSSQFKTYLLEELNRYLTNEANSEQIDIISLSCEHVMPQNNNENNPLLHTIGNLTLTDASVNSKLSDKDFAEKKELYKSSKVELNKYFDNIETWNDEEIKKRSKYLIDLIIKAFNIK